MDNVDGKVALTFNLLKPLDRFRANFSNVRMESWRVSRSTDAL